MGQRASITPQQGLDTSHPTTQPLPCELELDEYLKCLKSFPPKEATRCEPIRNVYSRCMQEREKHQQPNV